MATLDIKLLLLLVTTVTVFFIVATVVYRLYFHPLAKFPGPRLVAATSLPELWWDLIGQGAYLYKIEQMHEKYGPYSTFSFSLLSHLQSHMTWGASY